MYLKRPVVMVDAGLEKRGRCARGLVGSQGRRECAKADDALTRFADRIQIVWWWIDGLGRYQL